MTLLLTAGQAFHVFVACFFLAMLEIQIEGAHGWAKNLPTWRDHPSWTTKQNWFFGSLRWLFERSTGGNQLTGYHFYLMAFLFVLLTFPAAFSATPLTTLSTCVGYFFLMSVTWDFLWFVFNPSFGVTRFAKDHIAWHPRWLGPVPAPYPGGYVLGGVFISLGTGDWRTGWPHGLLALAVHLVLITGSIFAYAVFVRLRAKTVTRAEAATEVVRK